MTSPRVFVAAVLLTQALAAFAQEEPPAGPAPSASARTLRLSVKEVSRLALHNDPDFRTLVLDPEIARTFETEALAEFEPLFAARGAAGRARTPVFFDPTRSSDGHPGETLENRFSGSGGISKTFETGTSGSFGYQASSVDDRGASSIQSLSPRYDGTLSLGLLHPLLRGSGSEVVLSRTEEARAGTESTELRLARSAELTVAEAEASYWLLVGATADLEVKRKSLAVAKELLDLSQARLDSGRGILVDVTEARAGVAAREGDVIAAENRVANSADRLRARILPFTGEQVDLDLVVEPSDVPGAVASELPETPTRSEVERLMAGRSDVRAVESDLAAARISEFRAEDDTEYRLDAFGNGFLRGHGSGFGDSATEIGDRRGYGWEVGVQIEIPLGNELAESRARRARRETQKVERTLVSAQNQAIREIREATRNVRSAWERIQAAVRAVTAAEEQLAAEQARLANGVSRPFDVLQVEETLASSRADEIRARVDYEVARVELDLAQGSILVSRGLAENLESP